jgi:toxin ParE1/3/4
MTYRLSARAEADLTYIWVYSAGQWGIEQADRYVDALLQRLIWLSNNRSLWKDRPDIGGRLYSYPQQSHVIFFRPIGSVPEMVEIVRILHGRMDPSTHL